MKKGLYGEEMEGVRRGHQPIRASHKTGLIMPPPPPPPCMHGRIELDFVCKFPSSPSFTYWRHELACFPQSVQYAGARYE